MVSQYPIRILIAEDQSVFREGLHMIIDAQPDMTVVGYASTARETITAFRHHRPDLTFIDQELDGTGLAAMTSIRAEFPSARLVMLAATELDLVARRALRAGAVGYVLKSTPKQEILKITRSAHHGQKYVPTHVAIRLAEHLSEDDLTAREIDVLKLIGDGNRNKQIAGLLSIAEATVNFHIKNLVDKLRANDRTHAVAIAIRRGLL